MKTSHARMALAAAVWAGVAGVAGAAWGAGPATKAVAGKLVEVNPVGQLVTSESGGGETRFRMKLAAGVGAPSTEEIRDLIASVRWRSGETDAVVRWDLREYTPLDGEAVVECGQFVTGSPYGFERGNGGEPVNLRQAERASAGLIEGLGRILSAEGDVPAAERVRRVKEIEGRLAEVRSMQSALEAMAKARPAREGVLAERVKALRAERDRLQMAKAGKEARRKALQMGIAEARQKAAEEKKEDAVAKELRAVLELQEQEAKRIQTNVTNGAAGLGELTEAQTKVALARVRLAEREGAGGAAKGEVLGRMSDELSMVEVDDLELMIQIEQLDRKLAGLDPARATTQSLAAATADGTLPAGTEGMPPLFGELGKKEWELEREKVVLQVESVEEVGK